MSRFQSIALRYWPMGAVLIGLYGLHCAWAAILLYHAGLAVGIFLRPQALGTIRASKRGLRWLAPALLMGVAAFPAVLILLPPLLGLEAGQTGLELSVKLAATGLKGTSFYLFVLYFVTVHPLLEELGWRGVLSEDSSHPHLRDLEFAAYHLLVIHYLFPRAWLLMAAVLVSLTAAGWLWRRLREVSGGLLLPTLSHATGDAAVMGAVWLLMARAA